MSEATRVDCVCITGPTACGKTDLALALAERVPLEIVSMDSALVYRGLDIGTAKPSAEVRARVPHHLVDIVAPTEAYSAGRFARDAAALIDAIRGRGRLPVLVGGVLGLAAAIWLSRLISSLLFGITAGDVLTYVAATIAVLSASLLACYLPARAVLRVDPVVALRAE